MDDASRLLDQQLASLNRVVLGHGGDVRHEHAEAAARAQYKLFDDRRRAARRAEADRDLAALRQTDKALPKARRAPKNPGRTP